MGDSEPSRGRIAAENNPIYQNMDEKLKVQFGKHPKLYWIAIGKTDFLYKNNVDYRKKLDDNGYKYESYQIPIARNLRDVVFKRILKNTL